MPKNENVFVSTYTNMRIEGSLKFSHSTEFRDEGETECLCAFLCMDGGRPKVHVHPRTLLFLRRVKAIHKHPQRRNILKRKRVGSPEYHIRFCVYLSTYSVKR